VIDMAQTGQRGSGYVSPRNPTGRAFQEGLKRKQLADAQREREKKAVAGLAGGLGTDLDDIRDRHAGAPVYVDPDSGVVVVDYSGR
jgi:hypothetical protein